MGSSKQSQLLIRSVIFGAVGSVGYRNSRTGIQPMGGYPGKNLPTQPDGPEYFTQIGAA